MTTHHRRGRRRIIELYNRGSSPVDLSGWRFTDGITFTFAPNTVLAPGAYLAVCADVARLRFKYPGLNPNNSVETSATVWPPAGNAIPPASARTRHRTISWS